MRRPPPRSTLFPYTTLFRSSRVLEIEKPNVLAERVGLRPFRRSGVRLERDRLRDGRIVIHNYGHGGARSEEHRSELQSRQYRVCRLLLEKKNNKKTLIKLLD